MTIELSILISSHDRASLLRRTLYSIGRRPPPVPFEVVLADDGSSEDVLGELRAYTGRFPWRFVRVDRGVFEKETGVRPYFNNPAWTNNVAFKHSRGDWVVQQGNEVVAWGDVYAGLLERASGLLPQKKEFILFSTTLDVQMPVLSRLDSYGTNLTGDMVKQCEKWPLQSTAYRSDVTNYLSLSRRSLWLSLGGYDERFLAGIGAEDSDFVRRARALPSFAATEVHEGAVSLHQFHRGKTCRYDPPPSVITKERWDIGVAVNRAHYDAWRDGNIMSAKNTQDWPWGEIGVVDVLEK